MTIIDGLVVLAIFGGFAYIILAKMHKNNPEFIDKLKGWISSKPKVDLPGPVDKLQQVYDERRTMM